MQKVRISELSEDVRGFVADAFQRGGLVVEDDAGQPQVSVLSYRRPTAEEKQRAEESLDRLRNKTGQAMQDSGVTEEDVLKEILKDD